MFPLLSLCSSSALFCCIRHFALVILRHCPRFWVAFLRLCPPPFTSSTASRPPLAARCPVSSSRLRVTVAPTDAGVCERLRATHAKSRHGARQVRANRHRRSYCWSAEKGPLSARKARLGLFLALTAVMFAASGWPSMPPLPHPLLLLLLTS